MSLNVVCENRHVKDAEHPGWWTTNPITRPILWMGVLLFWGLEAKQSDHQEIIFHHPVSRDQTNSNYQALTFNTVNKTDYYGFTLAETSLEACGSSRLFALHTTHSQTWLYTDRQRAGKRSYAACWSSGKHKPLMDSQLKYTIYRYRTSGNPLIWRGCSTFPRSSTGTEGHQICKRKWKQWWMSKKRDDLCQWDDSGMRYSHMKLSVLSLALLHCTSTA